MKLRNKIYRAFLFPFSIHKSGLSGCVSVGVGGGNYIGMFS